MQLSQLVWQILPSEQQSREMLNPRNALAGFPLLFVLLVSFKKSSVRFTKVSSDAVFYLPAGKTEGT